MKTLSKFSKIEIKNYKSVENGSVILMDEDTAFNDEINPLNIIGIYGQNGTGKSSIIEYVSFLKKWLSYNFKAKDRDSDFFLMNGDLSERDVKRDLLNFNDNITTNGKISSIFITLLSLIYVNDEKYIIKTIYEANFQKSSELNTSNSTPAKLMSETIYSEKRLFNSTNLITKSRLSIDYSNKSDNKLNFLFTDLIKAKNRLLSKFDEEVFELRNLYQSAQKKSISLLINEDFSRIIKKIFSNDKLNLTFDSIGLFKDKLFNNTLTIDFQFESESIINFNLNFKNTDEITEYKKNIAKLRVASAHNTRYLFDHKTMRLRNNNDLIYTIKLNSYMSSDDENSYVMLESECEALDKFLIDLNLVLQLFLPDTKMISVKNNMKDNDKFYYVKLMIQKGSNAPFFVKTESAGIKKLINISYSILQLLRDSSFSLFIDELDSGIFEFLLGEILHLLKSKSRGQVLFTSHNFRGLETLNKNQVLFTSILNPKNRYIRIKNVKPTNNFRDFILKKISNDLNNEVYTKTYIRKIDKLINLD